MDKKDQILFRKLSEDRSESAKMLEKASMRGLKKSVVEKYSDQAHFIYELIQNADDVGATAASFVLNKDKLVFIHNGTRHFSVSDLEKEEEDSLSGTLGDLNAITSIANSNKTSASIGKFGVGFKAVFQYTTTPYIYDPGIAFKIENFIVPVLIENDFKNRKKDETAFVFPFDHPDRDADEAYDDIRHKLKRLVFPTLFLKNLKKITYRIGIQTGVYEKRVVEEKTIDGTIAQKLEFDNGDAQYSKNYLWIFTRETEEGYRYSCGFFIDDKDKLVQTNHYAFCFFPTKKTTNLNFIINAPFLLTDSREGIKAKNKHNIKMIDLLSDLAADSFIYLRDIGMKSGSMIIDDEILSYIPIKRELYVPNDEGDDISLLPFYEKIKAAFRDNALLPSFKDYVYVDDAYMAYASVISDLFTNKHLAQLVDNEDAKWVLPSKGWETLYRARDGKADYIRDLISDANAVSGIYRDVTIIDEITPEFINAQSKKWLLKFYKFVLETPNRVEKAKTAPIFITADGNAVAAYDENGNATLFVDDDKTNGYATIADDYYKEEVVRDLASRMGIKEPELKDKINKILAENEQFNPKTDFRTFLSYYIELVESGETTDDFISQISDIDFILGESEDKTETGVFSAGQLYYPTPELRKYFSGYQEAFFVQIDEYRAYLGKRKEMYLDKFLEDLGVSSWVCVFEHEYFEDDKKYINENFGTRWQSSSRPARWLDYRLDADAWVIQRIIDNKDKELSVLLWEQLILVFDRQAGSWGNKVFGGTYEYFYFSQKSYPFEGYGEKLFKYSAWLIDKEGKFKTPDALSIQQLDSAYDVSSDAARKLIGFLELSDEHPEYEGLSDEVRRKITLADELEKAGYFDLPEEKQRQFYEEFIKKNTSTTGSAHDTDGFEEQQESSREEKIIDDIKKGLKSRKQATEDNKNEVIAHEQDNAESENDSDEITKAPVDYSKKIEKAMQQCEDEIARLTQIEEARNAALEAKRYSFRWFMALLQLEAIANGEDNAKSREVSISFSRVELEEGTNRTLILKHPDKNIPMVMEELVDIPLDLSMDDGSSKRLVIEVANVKSYTLRVKVKQDDFIQNTDLSRIVQARIVAQNPSFLTKELIKQFQKFAVEPYNMDDEYDMQQNLCENISFIFGPPGTGKTTYVARNELLPLIDNNNKVKILVLTPTNKAADVLVSRTMSITENEADYSKWLIRYGVTGDESIEKSPVFHGKEIDIAAYKKCAVVTTIARLPYDYFIEPNKSRKYLRDIEWDYVVVDEASMIPLVQMVYMLYLFRTPKQFIVAGDPFQIEPTTSVAEWKSENIYKMVHLEEFSDNVDTVPHKYKITLLTKQYRSVESIGEVFSQLTYGGVLKHARQNEDARLLNIEKYLSYENLNIIRFPVSDFESIYRAKRLKLSSYQIYSALFVYEFASYIAKALAKENEEQFNIGIIAPYGAQAGLIDKLLASADLPENIKVSSGTIHGFQGDECDIIIAVFNPPPHISTNEEMFLNRQNIVNVAISRARDYLFILMPDEDTKNVQNLFLINKLKRLVEKDLHTDQNTKDLEELLFDNADYLEENAFSTGHQMVNVYGLPEKHYEIRSEENALDVQVYGTSSFRLLQEEEKNGDDE